MESQELEEMKWRIRSLEHRVETLASYWMPL